MNEKRVFSDKMIKQCISTLLPNQVLFAMGDSDRVECASIWINKLKQENENLKKENKELRKVKDHCTGCGTTEFLCGCNKR